jgi:hypothetical protein
MTGAEGMPMLPRSVTSTELRQLWESGRRGPAIRRALEGWDELLRSGDDLRWLEGEAKPIHLLTGWTGFSG